MNEAAGKEQALEEEEGNLLAKVTASGLQAHRLDAIQDEGDKA